MQFGIPNLIELRSLNDCTALCKELDLQLVELNMNLPKYFYLAKTQNCQVVLETKTVAGLKESVEWIKSEGK